MLRGMTDDDVGEDTEAAGEPLEWPLEWLPERVELLRYDAADGDDCALRIFFNLVGDHPPGPSLSDISTRESDDRVAVTVIRRTLEGMRPDGAETGQKLISCLSCVQIPLRLPLGHRQVIDGSTGLTVTRLNRAPVFDPEQGDLDHHFGELARTDGCPLWR
jgi:hypothetical protein